MKKTYLYIFIATISLLLGANNYINASTITIEADKQSFQIKDNTALFNGNVRVSYDNFKINSPKAVLSSNSKGEPDKAIFSEGVSVYRNNKNNNDSLNSDSLILFMASNNLIAEGKTVSHFKKNTPNAVTIRAHRQEFNSKTNEVSASGSVVINLKDMILSGGSANLQTTADGKPSKAIFSNSARVVKGDSTITAGTISIELSSNNITASGGVNTVTNLKETGKVSMRSNTQTYTKSTNELIGSGNVTIEYQDYKASGHKATLYLSPDNSLQKIVFIGRSQIKDSLRKVTADKIVVSVNPKNFTAEGNVRTQVTRQDQPPKTATKSKEKPPINPENNIKQEKPASATTKEGL